MHLVPSHAVYRQGYTRILYDDLETGTGRVAFNNSFAGAPVVQTAVLTGCPTLITLTVSGITPLGFEFNATTSTDGICTGREIVVQWWAASASSYRGTVVPAKRMILASADTDASDAGGGDSPPPPPSPAVTSSRTIVEVGGRGGGANTPLLADFRLPAVRMGLFVHDSTLALNAKSHAGVLPAHLVLVGATASSSATPFLETSAPFVDGQPASPADSTQYKAGLPPPTRQKLNAWSTPSGRVQSLTLPVQVPIPPTWHAGGEFPDELTAGVTVLVESSQSNRDNKLGGAVWASTLPGFAAELVVTQRNQVVPPAQTAWLCEMKEPGCHRPEASLCQRFVVDSPSSDATFCSTATPRTLPKLSAAFGSADAAVHIRVRRRELSYYEVEYAVEFYKTVGCSGVAIRTETFNEFGECSLLESQPPRTTADGEGWFGGMPYVGLYRDCPQCGDAAPVPPTGDFIVDAECHRADAYAPSVLNGFGTWGTAAFREPVPPNAEDEVFAWEIDPVSGDLLGSITQVDLGEGGGSSDTNWVRAQVVGLPVGNAGRYTLHFEVGCTLDTTLAIGSLFVNDKDLSIPAQKLASQGSCSASDPSRKTWLELSGSIIDVTNAEADRGVLWLRMTPGGAHGRLSRIMLMRSTAGGGGSLRLQPTLPTAAWLPPCAAILAAPEQCVSAGCGYSALRGCYEATEFYDVLDSSFANSGASIGADSSLASGGASAGAGDCKSLSPWACTATVGCSLDFESSDSDHCVATASLSSSSSSSSTAGDATEDLSCKCAEAAPKSYDGSTIERNLKSFCIASGCKFGKIKIKVGEFFGEGDRCYNTTSAPDDRQNDNCAELIKSIPPLHWNKGAINAGCFSSSEAGGARDGGTSATPSSCFAAQTRQSRPSECLAVAADDNAPEYQRIACVPTFYCPAVAVIGGTGAASADLAGIYFQSTPPEASNFGPTAMHQWTKSSGGGGGIRVSFVTWPADGYAQAMFVSGRVGSVITTADNLVNSNDAIAISAPTTIKVPASEDGSLHATRLQAQDWTALSPQYGFGELNGLVAKCVCLMPTAWSVSISTLQSIQVVLHFPQTATLLLERKEGESYTTPLSFTLHISNTQSAKEGGALNFAVSSTPANSDGNGWAIQSSVNEAVTTFTKTFAVDERFQLDEYTFVLDVDEAKTCAGAQGILHHKAVANSNTAVGGQGEEGDVGSNDNDNDNEPVVVDAADNGDMGVVDVVASTIETADGRATVKVQWRAPRALEGDSLFELAVKSRSLEGQFSATKTMEGSVIISAFGASCSTATRSSLDALFDSFEFLFGNLPGETANYAVHVRRVFASPELQEKATAVARAALNAGSAWGGSAASSDLAASSTALDQMPPQGTVAVTSVAPLSTEGDAVVSWTWLPAVASITAGSGNTIDGFVAVYYCTSNCNVVVAGAADGARIVQPEARSAVLEGLRADAIFQLEVVPFVKLAASFET